MHWDCNSVLELLKKWVHILFPYSPIFSYLKPVIWLIKFTEATKNIFGKIYHAHSPLFELQMTYIFCFKQLFACINFVLKKAILIYSSSASESS